MALGSSLSRARIVTNTATAASFRSPKPTGSGTALRASRSPSGVVGLQLRDDLLGRDLHFVRRPRVGLHDRDEDILGAASVEAALAGDFLDHVVPPSALD